MSTRTPAPHDESRLAHHHVGVPRWSGAVALLAIGGLYLLVSEPLTLGPSWLLLILVAVLFVPVVVARLRGRHNWIRWLALVPLGAVTITLGASVVFLLRELLTGERTAHRLLLDATLIWLANVVTFAVWYWEIDAGGPGRRHREHHHSTDFLFPQLALPAEARAGWSPGFVDYLFLAFTTSTAFGPTDTAVLSRRAKTLMMAQTLISLVVIAVLAARAINTL